MRNVVLFGDNLQKLSTSHVNASAETNKRELTVMKALLRNGIKNTLTDRQRECLLLYYFKEMNLNEIADHLGISPSTVSRHIKAARKNLSKLNAYFEIQTSNNK